MLKSLATALIAAAAFAGTAHAQTVEAGPTPGPGSGERADIPFATHNGIRTFTPERNGEGVYLQDNRKNWYYASFFSRCTELPHAMQFGFKTFGSSTTLSRGDTVIAGRDTCKIADLVRSGPPPEKAKKARKGAKPDKS
jgi:hypothetical protein